MDRRSGSFRGATALVVDDDEYVCLLVSRALGRLGLRTFAAQTAPQGLDLARLLRPRLAVVDVGLPGFDGFELTRRLRQEPELETTTVVILSGHRFDPEFARRMGAQEALHKPVRVSRLLETVDRLLH
jgi:CheY-like chemotaxis protein